MNALELLRGFLQDLLRLPLSFKLFMLYAAAAAGWQWWRRRQQAEVVVASESWPVYRGRVVWAQVSERASGGENGPANWEGLLTYSYTVPGHELEVGEFRKRFEDEDDADAWARGLRDTFVDVRVDPADVRRSLWQETPVMTVPPLRAPELDASRLGNMGPWGIREVAAAVTFSVAAAGAFFAAWIQLSCLVGKPLITAEGNVGVFFGMHAGAILCAIASGLITKRGKWSRSNWGNTFKTGTSGFAMKILGGYTAIAFFYGWVRMAANDGDSRFWGILMFSAVWLIFYVAAASGCLCAIQQRGGEAS